MKSVSKKACIRYPMLLCSLIFSATVLAANDPSIKGELRQNITIAMENYIQGNTIDGLMYVYDSVDGKLLKLNFDKLHDGIVDKNGFYVSCADFKDQNGRKVDIDFLVRPAGDGLITTQALVHAIDGNKRQYQLENS